MIGKEFNELRTRNRAEAYKRKQQRINEFFGILTEVVSPKDLLDEARRCEEFMGGSETPQGASALDELAKFLNGTPAQENRKVM